MQAAGETMHHNRHNRRKPKTLSIKKGSSAALLGLELTGHNPNIDEIDA